CGRNRSFLNRLPQRITRKAGPGNESPARLRQLEEWTVEKDETKKALKLRATFINSGQLPTNATISSVVRVKNLEFPGDPVQIQFPSEWKGTVSVGAPLGADFDALLRGDMPYEMDVHFKYADGQGKQCQFVQTLTLIKGGTHIALKQDQEGNQSCQ